MVEKRKTSRLGKAALVMGSVTALTVGVAGSASAGPNLTNLPESATSFQKSFQPYFDYDNDGCFPAAAIDMWGNLNGGLRPTGSLGGGCRTDHLGNANTYSRAKCNNGWCGIIYTLYFEKDEASPGIGHRHDWECAVVWVKQGASKPSYLSASRHGGFSTHPVNEVPMDSTGAHVEIVYHKDGASTHAFRFAKWGETPEAWGNGGWDHPALVSWDHYPASKDPSKNLQTIMNNSSWGNANFPLQDAKFDDHLNKAKPSGIPFNPYA
ncbi:NPP1 family protein [Streptomyces sp. NPDC001795]|uniref:NPP1 family protein n=1 Tax=Streptomyces sp. NPDC001795 TaxID=3154525 RepID=UPI00331F2C49